MTILKLNLIYITTLVILVSGFLFYFLTTRKIKGLPINQPTKLFEKIANREYLICGYHFKAASRNEAVKKLKRLCSKKGLEVFLRWQGNRNIFKRKEQETKNVELCLRAVKLLS